MLPLASSISDLSPQRSVLDAHRPIREKTVGGMIIRDKAISFCFVWYCLPSFCFNLCGLLEIDCLPGKDSSTLRLAGRLLTRWRKLLLHRLLSKSPILDIALSKIQLCRCGWQLTHGGLLKYSVAFSLRIWWDYWVYPHESLFLLPSFGLLPPICLFWSVPMCCF